MTQAQPRRIGVVARLRYRFDMAMSRGTGIVILWLAGITFGLVFVAALVLTVFRIGVNEDKTPSLLERFWQSLLRILDPGTFSGDAGWPLRITMLLVTLLGVLIGGSLIGLIVAAVDGKVEQLRRGRSVVAERGHTLILGWSPRVFTLISKIVEANANQRRARIVVLAPEEKPVMEEAIRDRVGDTKTTRIVCRTGDPASPHDLRIANIDEARSIVVLAGGGDGAGDAEAVKAALAVMTRESHRAHTTVVAEMNDIETARALHEATGGRVVTVRAVDVVARITGAGVPPARAELRMAGPARLRRRRDLFPACAGARWAHVRRSAAGLRHLDCDRSSQRRRDDRGQPADGQRVRGGRLGHRDLGG